MTLLQQRLFIFLDEWLGIALLLYLHMTNDRIFWWVLPVWAVMTYIIAYPTYWLRCRKEDKMAQKLYSKVTHGFQTTRSVS